MRLLKPLAYLVGAGQYPRQFCSGVEEVKARDWLSCLKSLKPDLRISHHVPPLTLFHRSASSGASCGWLLGSTAEFASTPTKAYRERSGESQVREACQAYSEDAVQRRRSRRSRRSRVIVQG